MDKNKAKRANLARRHRRVRGKVFGTQERPRLCVRRSNTNIYAMLIDDVKGHTLCAASSLDKDFKKGKASGSNKEGAARVGELIAKKAKKAGYSVVTFDRGGRIYHGRVKALAEAARESGLQF